MMAYFKSSQLEVHVHTQELKFYSAGNTLCLHYDCKSVYVKGKARSVTYHWRHRGETRGIAVPILNLGVG